MEILPCLVSEVTTPVEPQTYTYTIGEESFNFGEVVFEHDSLCEFEYTYEMTGAPSNMEFRSE